MCEQTPIGKFQEELESLINKYSLENGSDTPDFILAEYLGNCLLAFNTTLQRREAWYGRTKAAIAVPPPEGE